MGGAWRTGRGERLFLRHRLRSGCLGTAVHDGARHQGRLRHHLSQDTEGKSDQAYRQGHPAGRH